MNSLQKQLLISAKTTLLEDPIYAKELLNEVLAVEWKKLENVKQPYYISFTTNLYDSKGNVISWGTDKAKKRKQAAELFLEYALGRKGYDEHKDSLKYNASEGRWQILLTAYYVDKIIKNIEKYDGMVPIPGEKNNKYKGEDLYLSNSKKGKWNEGTPYNKATWEKVILDNENADNLEKLKTKYKDLAGFAVDADYVLDALKKEGSKDMDVSVIEDLTNVLDSVFSVLLYAKDEFKPSSDVKNYVKKEIKDAKKADSLPLNFLLLGLFRDLVENMSKSTNPTKNEGDELVPKPKMLNNKFDKIIKKANKTIEDYKQKIKKEKEEKESK